MRLPRTALAVATAGVALIPAAAADAATKDVLAGMPRPQAGDGWKRGFEDNAFYPRTVTVARGDTLRFTVSGVHNVLYSPKGQAAPRFDMPDPAHPVTGLKDAAGADYWCNGQPSIAIDPRVLTPQGGTEVDGSALTGSGLALPGAEPKPYRLKMTGKPGVYRFVCSVHPGMDLDVTVKPRGAKVPGAREDRRRAKAQYAAAVRRVAALAKAKLPPARTVQAGNDDGPLVFFGFRPARTTVRAGQAVTFRMSRRSAESHNVAFGPAAYLDGLSARLLAPTRHPDGAFAVTLNPEVVYPSQPPSSPLVVQEETHGNGFVNSGFLDADPKTPLPSAATVRFPTPGTYAYLCNLHPSMRGQVTVK